MLKKQKPVKKTSKKPLVSKTTGTITKKSDAKKREKIVKSQSTKKAASNSKK